MSEQAIVVVHNPERDEAGVWCSRCCSLGAVSVHFSGLTEDGTIPALASRVLCPRCDSETFLPDGEDA